MVDVTQNIVSANILCISAFARACAGRGSAHARANRASEKLARARASARDLCAHIITPLVIIKIVRKTVDQAYVTQ